MSNELKKQPNSERLTLGMYFAAFLALCIVFSMVPVYAWFYFGRSAAAVAKISNPTALYISAGHKEDAAYMDMTGIDLTKGTLTNNATKMYMDFVFCVYGNNVNTYKLQLAYTTNNQFEYDIFPAVETTKAEWDNAPAANLGVVEYNAHLTSAVYCYYIPENGTKLNGSFINRKQDNDILALTDGDTGTVNKHAATYGDYNYVQKYAEPLYWQTTDNIYGSTAGSSTFEDYYILRVYWKAGQNNTKETDIIYISARNMTS